MLLASHPLSVHPGSHVLPLDAFDTVDDSLVKTAEVHDPDCLRDPVRDLQPAEAHGDEQNCVCTLNPNHNLKKKKWILDFQNQLV